MQNDVRTGLDVGLDVGLPETEHEPAELRQGVSNLLVALDVAGELLPPVFLPRCDLLARIFLVPSRMPKIAVHENGDFLSRQGDVRRAGKRPASSSDSEAPINPLTRNIPMKIRATFPREEHLTVLGLNIPTTNATRDNAAIILKAVSILHLFSSTIIRKMATVERKRVNENVEPLPNVVVAYHSQLTHRSGSTSMTQNTLHPLGKLIISLYGLVVVVRRRLGYMSEKSASTQIRLQI